MDDVYIVEIATTGDRGFPHDAVAQVAVCRMLADGSDYDTVYDDLVRLDPKDIGHDGLQRLSDTYGIPADALYMGEAIEDVVRRTFDVLKGRECTSFSRLTFSKFLCFEPWDLNGEVTFLPPLSIMIPREYREGTDAESIVSVYRRLCPDDPASVGDSRTAVDMAQMSACIAMSMRGKGFY